MIKTVEDYYDRLYKMFPEVPKEDIRRSVNYGWRKFYWYNLRGCDVQIKSANNDFWMHCGILTKDSIKHFNLYKQKLSIKVRLKYARKHKDWDGFYYSVIDEDTYQNIKDKQSFDTVLKDKCIFKILDECKLYYNDALYFIKFRMSEDIGWKKLFQDLECKDCEIIYKRTKGLTLKDLINYKL